MKVFSARVNKGSSRQRSRSLDRLESFYQRCTSQEKSTSAKSTRNTRLGRECNSSFQRKRQPSSQNLVPHDISTFRAQNQTKGVKFSETNYDSWYRSDICSRHLMRNSDNNDKTIAGRERDYCEVLGNKFCKACCKTNARKECKEDFDLTYLKPKSAGTQDTRSMTPLSDIILCKFPPLPQSNSKGLFVRLHELQRVPPQYYINPMGGIYQHDVQPLHSEQIVVTFNTAETNDAQEFEWSTKMSRKETSIVQEDERENIVTKPEERTVKSAAALRHFKTVGNVALASVPVRKSNTFHPQLHIKEINKQIKLILTERKNEFAGITRRESFKEKPIEPPQITVKFALGIYDPKKRQVKRETSYSANL